MKMAAAGENHNRTAVSKAPSPDPENDQTLGSTMALQLRIHPTRQFVFLRHSPFAVHPPTPPHSSSLTMASDKRPILSGKRARNRRKRAAFRAANRATASPSPEVDSDEDFKHKQLVLPCGPDSDNSTSQSENENELDTGIVFVCCPTMPDFCSVFLPRGEEPAYNRSGKMTSDCRTFTVHVPSFQETHEGYVTYTVEIKTCDQPNHIFQVERRFSEFAACATEVNKQFANGLAAHYCTQQEENSEVAALNKANNFQWELPSKTWFRVTQTSALEERREQLEQALETLLQQQERRICNLPVLRDFLMLDIFGVQVAEQKNLEAAAHLE